MNKKTNNLGILTNTDYYKKLFYGAPSAIFIVDVKTGILLDTNKAGEKLVGRSREELIGSNYTILHPKEKIKEYKHFFLKNVKQKKGAEFKINIIKKDGTLVPVSILSSVFSMNGRQIIKGVFTDISYIKKIEENLLESQKNLKLAQEITKTGSWYLDIVKNKLVWSDEIYRMFGIKQKDFKATYQAFLARIHPEDREAVNKAYLTSLEEKKPYEIIHRVVTKKGDEIFVKEKCETTYNKKGEPLYSIGTVQDITKEKLSEEKIKESEEKYRLLFETSNNAIMTLDPPKWNFTSGNPAIVKMFGVKNEEEFKKLKPWQVSPKYQPDGQLSSIKAKKMIDIAMKKGDNFFEWTHKKINNGDFFATVSLNKIELSSRSFLQARVTDITKEKENKQKIKASEEKFKSVVINSKSIIFIIDKTGKFILSEGKELSSIGLKPGQVVGISALKMYKEYPEIIKGIKNGWNGKTTETSSKLKIGKNFVYFDVLCTPYRNGGSNILGTIGVATNVTEKYLADEKIKEKVGETIIEKEKLSKIVQSIGEGVFVINEDRKLILSNRTACTLANLKHTENCCTGMDYRKIFKFFYEKDGKENKDFIDNVFKTKESQEVPIFNHHNTNLVGKNATPIPVSIKATPIKDNKDKIIGCVVIFKDVGEERKLDRTKSEFISVASHSLRTPISGVKWLAELLLEEKIGKLNKKQKHYLKKIQEANENSIELVNSLLIISRIESGKLSLVRRKKIKVFNLINKILIFYADKIKNKKLRFYLNCGLLEDTFIYLDEEKALIIFDNLIGNSIKYSKDGGRITLSCKKKHNKILFEIQDGGYGIPLKEQDKIFEKFFRGTNVQALKESGTGLGLFIVKSLIEAHGGKIWFDSEENKGTTFFFYLEK